MNRLGTAGFDKPGSPIAMAFLSQRGSSRGIVRIEGQQFLEKATEFLAPVDKVDFQNPMARPAHGIRFAQRLTVAMTDGEPGRIRRRALMRKVPDQMSGGLGAEFPARRRRESGDEVVEAARRQIRRLAIKILPASKRAAMSRTS